VGRIRTVKPSFFKHYDLYVLESETGLPVRLAFAGLWCCADREGRFKWRPQELRVDIMPHDKGLDFEAVLYALASHGFIIRYEVDNSAYAYIPTWKEHQVINAKEAKSTIPPPDTGLPVNSSESTEIPFVEGKGRERKGKEGNSASEDANTETADTFFEEEGMSVVNRLKKLADQKFGRRESDNHYIWIKVKSEYKNADERKVAGAFIDWAESLVDKQAIHLPVSAFMGVASDYLSEQDSIEQTGVTSNHTVGQQLFIHMCKASKGRVIPDAKQQKLLAQAAGTYSFEVLKMAFDRFWSGNLDEFNRNRAAKLFCEGVVGLAELALSEIEEQKKREELRVEMDAVAEQKRQEVEAELRKRREKKLAEVAVESQLIEEKLEF
jgi:major membrane immunogen (membrane-anchored lipoprotein)